MVLLKNGGLNLQKWWKYISLLSGEEDNPLNFRGGRVQIPFNLTKFKIFKLTHTETFSSLKLDSEFIGLPHVFESF